MPVIFLNVIELYQVPSAGTVKTTEEPDKIKSLVIQSLAFLSYSPCSALILLARQASKLAVKINRHPPINSPKMRMVIIVSDNVNPLREFRGK